MLFSAMDYSRSAAHPTDEKKSVDLSYYIHRHVADAVSKLTALPAAELRRQPIMFRIRYNPITC